MKKQDEDLRTLSTIVNTTGTGLKTKTGLNSPLKLQSNGEKWIVGDQRLIARLQGLLSPERYNEARALDAETPNQSHITKTMTYRFKWSGYVSHAINSGTKR